jgi:hypothetical protein
MRKGDRSVTEPVRVDVSYENSGYDTLTSRAVAIVTTDQGKQVFRGAWVNDGNIKALESLLGKMADVILTQMNEDRLRCLEEASIMQRKIGGLQAEIDEMRNNATRSGLSTLMARSREVQHQRNLLEVEVTEQRAKLARIHAAVDQLIGAVGEP